jgi:hypothetical protein
MSELIVAYSRTFTLFTGAWRVPEGSVIGSPEFKRVVKCDSRRGSLRVKSLASTPQNRLTRRPSAISSRITELMTYLLSSNLAAKALFHSVCDEVKKLAAVVDR